MSYSLLLRRLPERDSAELTVRADDTVATICQRAAVAFGRAEADAARLCCFRGEVLPPTATLSAAGVTAAHFAVVCFAPCAPALTRVCGGKGWVVHGVVLEFSDGVRTGYFGENDGSPMALSDDAGLARRGGVWYDVRPGEKLVMVTGRDSSMGYLCGSVTLQLSSGRAISVAGENPSVFGGAFTHAVPEQPASSRYVEPRFDAGRCTGLHRCGQPPTAPAAPAGAAEPSGEPPRVLNSVAQLLSWRPPAGAAVVAARAPSAPRAALPPRPRTLHCHDMAGGYNAKADGAYLAAFSGWEEVDVFVYFAHNRVSMPPRVWVDACHARGVPCLGTLIIEADDGENDALLSDVEGAVESLCALCEHHGFDGWLVNLEAPLRHPSGAAGVARLRELLELLTICLKPRVGEQALCLLYDSLNEAGQVRYQNALTPANASLFGACDGLFTNYWWGPPQLSLSVSLAGPSAPGTPDRRHDVYCGVDCFARNCSYAEGLGCAAPCRAARNAGLSLALFAPGWSLERGPGSRAPDDAAAARADREFWDALGLRRM